MNLRSAIFIIVTMILVQVYSCDSQNKEQTFTGLIGAYYGENDFTNIKESEVLSRLTQFYDEETGHGNAWSAVWEGYIIAPISGEVTFNLSSTKNVSLQLGNDVTLIAGNGRSESEASISMNAGEPVYLKLKYSHAGGRAGEFSVKWRWEKDPFSEIPQDALYFTANQALNWNWLPEPKAADIDSNQFMRVEGKNIIVYYEPGRFCGWPANNGLWHWDNEILVGFTLAYYQEKEHHHSVDESKPSLSVLARSKDSGMTWAIEDPENYVGDGGSPIKLQEKINFNHPDLVIRCAAQRFYYSYDRGKTWMGPFLFPDFGREKITSRTDYLVNNTDNCLFFLSTREDSVQSNMQDRAFCAQTDDGGLTFKFLSWIGDPITVRSVMPSTVRISDSSLVSALRRRIDEQTENKPRLAKNWIDLYQSNDNGHSWHFLSKVADTDMGKDNGNPPSLVRLNDARLVVTWGYRAKPYGIRARISKDNGRNWGKVIHLRDDARTFDFGYTRSMQRPDGKIVTIYYYTTEKNREQHIAATIWDPDEIQ